MRVGDGAKFGAHGLRLSARPGLLLFPEEKVLGGLVLQHPAMPFGHLLQLAR